MKSLRRGPCDIVRIPRNYSALTNQKAWTTGPLAGLLPNELPDSGRVFPAKLLFELIF